jgi:hypothetical protein
MSDLQLLPLGGELLYTFDFTLEVPSLVTVTGIDYTVPSELTQFADNDDLANKKGTIGLRAHATNGKHGQTAQVKAVATLSNTEKVPKYLAIRLTGS